MLGGPAIGADLLNGPARGTPARELLASESGRVIVSLPTQLSNAAVFYERELTFRLKRFTDMFEPAIILVVGGMVAFVAIAQISAMYSVYHQIKI